MAGHTAPHDAARTALVHLWEALEALPAAEARALLHDKQAFLPGLDHDEFLRVLAADRARHATLYAGAA